MNADDGFWECCGEILLTIGLALLFAWAEENPFWSTVIGVTFLGAMMVGLPVYWFFTESAQKMKGGIVVGYFLGFFAWIMAIIVGVVSDLFAVLGVCVFIGIGIAGLTYLIIRGKVKRWEEKRKKAVSWELKDRLKELEEQMGRGVITKEKYEQKKKKLLERLKLLGKSKKRKELSMEPVDLKLEALAWELEDQLKELKEQLDSGVITQEEYEQKRKELLEGLMELKRQLLLGNIHLMEYEQKKKKLLGKSGA